MATIELNLADLRQHVGKKSVSTDVVNPGPANLLRVALGRAEPEFKTGDPLPPAWISLRARRCGHRRSGTGSYELGFRILAGMAALGSVFFVLARRPSPPRRIPS